MKTVTSKDGTRIAFDQYGQGPALILVAGAIQHRAMDQDTPRLAELLGQHFTVYNYDRRGRGDSTDTLPYAVEREIEDIEALIDEAGGTASLYGVSSEAALVLEAALRLGDKLTKIALYEAPYNDDAEAKRTWKTYTKQLADALAVNKRGDAVALFMRLTGAPDEGIEQMRHSPIWPVFEAVAPTLAYDHNAILGEEAAVPSEKAGRVKVPALVMAGEASYPFMLETAATLAKAMPNAQQRTLAGQTHEVAPEAVAPVLIAFLRGS